MNLCVSFEGYLVGIEKHSYTNGDGVTSDYYKYYFAIDSTAPNVTGWTTDSFYGNKVIKDCEPSLDFKVRVYLETYNSKSNGTRFSVVSIENI